MIEEKEKNSGYNALVSFVNDNLDNEKNAIILCLALTHENGVNIEYLAYRRNDPSINKTRYVGNVLNSEQDIKLFKIVKGVKTTEQLEKLEKNFGKKIKRSLKR